RFVEQRDAFGYASEAYERAASSITGKRRQIAIVKPDGDFGRLSECGVTCGRIALHNSTNGGGNQQKSAYDGGELRLVEDAFSSCEPAGCRSHGAALQKAERKPEGGSSGSFTVASIEECLMRARTKSLALVILSHEVGCSRESFEVFGVKGGFTVGR